MNFDGHMNRRANRYLSRGAMFLAALALLVFASYKKIGATPMHTQVPIELYIGESGKSFAVRNATTVDRQPAGLNFYELHWPFESMGSVILKQGDKRVKIANVLGVTGTEDMDLQGEGLSDIKINSAISEEEKISHDEARLKTFAYLKNISERGWETTIPRGMARIRGKDMSDYLLQTQKSTTLDPRYVPTLSEWMQYEDLTSWEFYQDHVYLTVQITREHTMTDPLKLGAYLLSTSAQSEAEHFRDHVGGLDRPRWKQFLHEKVARLAQSRQKKEAELKVKGVAIDEAYVDPPLPDLSKY